MYTHLIAVDIGNVNIKLRSRGANWDIVPSVVRRAPDRATYRLVDDEQPRPLRYLSGPAATVMESEEGGRQSGIDPHKSYLLGHDAVRYGVADEALIGSAELRVSSAAYLLLHLWSIAASLPPSITDQPRRHDEPIRSTVVLAGGLPYEDSFNDRVKRLLRQRLTGRKSKDDPPLPHRFMWGETSYELTIARVSLDPQVVAALATLMFSSDGKILTNGALHRTRFALDIGGGTTDYCGRVGLDPIPGSEGSMRRGLIDAALKARDLIQRKHRSLRNLEVGDVLQLYRTNTTTVYVGGEPQDVRSQLEQATRDTASEILPEILPRWERQLASGEVLLFGGGGKDMAGPIGEAVSPITRVTLLDNAIFRVADGLERLAKYRLQAE